MKRLARTLAVGVAAVVLLGALPLLAGQSSTSQGSTTQSGTPQSPASQSTTPQASATQSGTTQSTSQSTTGQTTTGQSFGNVPPPPGANVLTLPAGSTLHVRLTTTLTSKTNKNGDPFTAEITEAVRANGKEIVPEGSLAYGHVAFLKPPGRVTGRSEMRVVLDRIETQDDIKFALGAPLEEAQGAPCATTTGEEGTIKGCGKSKKDAAKDAAIGGAMGAGAGATVGMGHQIECEYYGQCGGPGWGTDIGVGAAIGAGTALAYHLLKKERDIILVEGTHLTFVVNRTVDGAETPQTANAAANP
ncbi:MAG: hypothetical protein ACLQOO_32945 [Terriglobia bacterium]